MAVVAILLTSGGRQLLPDIFSEKLGDSSPESLSKLLLASHWYISGHMTIFEPITVAGGGIRLISVNMNISPSS